MAEMLLGKRTRSNIDTDSPAKRRVVLNGTDENENPFVTTNTPALRKTRSSTRVIPAKHGAPEKSTIAPSPKISAHFKPTKAFVEVHQDEKKVPSTPSRRDAKKIPATPRHRVIVGSALRVSTPQTPRTPGTLFTGPSVYNQARQLFARCANPGKLVGRDEERRQLSSFVEDSIKSKSGGCLYVSGPPGTGKSALLDSTLR